MSKSLLTIKDKENHYSYSLASYTVDYLYIFKRIFNIRVLNVPQIDFYIKGAIPTLNKRLIFQVILVEK